MKTNSNETDISFEPCSVLINFVNVVLLCLYSVLFLIAVGGNALVVYVILSQQRMRTVTNFFLLNLAVGDIAKAFICIPFTFVVNVLVSYWPFGPFMCPFVLYMQSVVVFVSAFTLVAMSVDRYVAILYPLRKKMTMTKLIIIIVIIWTIALAVPLPTTFKSHIVNPFVNVSNECQLGLCIEDMGNKEVKHVYTMTIMCLQYFVPLTVLMFTYSKIGYVIWIKTTPGEAERRRDERIASSKRKMVKMMIVVVIIYAICWLPIHAIKLVEEGNPDIYNFDYYQAIWMTAHWLAMSYACYNPIVYFWMNKRFRVGFKGALLCCKSCKTSIALMGSSARMTLQAQSNSLSSTKYSPKNSMEDHGMRILHLTLLQKGEEI